MRLLAIGLLAFATVFGAFNTAVADDLSLASGQLAYLHGPVDPKSAQLCEGPIPGLLFTGVGGTFVINAPDQGFSAIGTGTADTCAFFAPIFGIYAQYSGTVELETNSGKKLYGTFFGLDLEPLVYAGDQPLVFETVAVLNLTDEDGKFAGLLTATGIDNPFALPLGDPFPAGTGGVFATFDGLLVGDDN